MSSFKPRTLEHWNAKMTALAAPAMGLPTINDVLEKAATAVAVEVVIAVAGGSMAAAIVAAMVRAV
jgi:hypothetical protein